MSKFNLNIEDIVYIEVDIQGTNLTPTTNLIHTVSIQDGFGIAIPTLELELYDQKGTLMTDLMLTDATVIKIKISQKAQEPSIYNFRVFNFKQSMSNIGPMLNVLCLLDIPLYSCATVRKAYKGTSKEALESVASDAGLKFKGDATKDTMKWLCVCETLSSFAEDIAMYGWASDKSCMAKVVTAENTLKYLDLFQQLKRTPTVTILHNTPATASGIQGTPYSSREVKDMSIAGVMNHYLNYGFILAEHRLEGTQKVIDKAEVPKLGPNMAINSDVKSMVKNARVEYAGHFDTGHSSQPAYNIHDKWNEARYQNLRFLSLFTQRLRVLVEDKTVAETFDTIKVLEMEYSDKNLEPNNRTSSTYLCGGKTMRVINGNRYYEVLDLYRPYFDNKGNTPVV